MIIVACHPLASFRADDRLNKDMMLSNFVRFYRMDMIYNRSIRSAY